MQNTEAKAKNFKMKLSFEFFNKKNEMFSSDEIISQNTKEKILIADSFSTKEDVLEEIKNQFQEVLKEVNAFLKSRDITENKTEAESDLLL